VKAGVIVRKPLSADFMRWDVMADVAFELPFRRSLVAVLNASMAPTSYEAP